MVQTNLYNFIHIICVPIALHRDMYVLAKLGALYGFLIQSRSVGSATGMLNHWKNLDEVPSAAEGKWVAFTRHAQAGHNVALAGQRVARCQMIPDLFVLNSGLFVQFLL